jgi:hypothetical protein
MKVLFLNHKKKQCGVYQYGIRIFDILKNTENIHYIYKEVSSLEEYNTLIDNLLDTNIILYNYHSGTLSWLNKYTIQKKIKNIGILHESSFEDFDYAIDIGNISHESYIPRPIFENIDKLLENYIPSTTNIRNFINYNISNVPIIGSFGFGFDNKGFEKIIKMVNAQYDSAIIKLVITKPDFDHPISHFENILNNCIRESTKPNIFVQIIREFFTTEDILLFLKSNTINVFLYDEMIGRGLSSAVDYAISAMKPIGISDSFMFRHIYSDELCLYKTSINDCILNFEKYREKLLNENSNQRLINKFKHIIHKVYSQSQIYQDIFALKMSKEKKYGYFLEIGSHNPITCNNSFILENGYNWKGLMVEYDTSFENLYKIHRPNSIYELNDARLVNYRQIMDSNNFPINMDYLQIDLDVDNKSTLDTLLLLNNTIFDKYKFAAITFEHDIYRGNYFDTKKISRQIFKDRGYVLVFPDIKVFWEGGYKPFEDWYIHPELVDMDHINKIKTDISLTREEIILLL